MEGGKEEIWNTLESYNILEKLFLEEEKEKGSRILHKEKQKDGWEKQYEYIDALEKRKELKGDENVEKIIQDAYKEDPLRLFHYLADKKNLVEYWAFLRMFCSTKMLCFFVLQETEKSLFYYECARQLFHQYCIDERWEETLITAILQVAKKDQYLWSKWIQTYEYDKKWEGLMGKILEKAEDEALITYAQTISLDMPSHNGELTVITASFHQISQKRMEYIWNRTAKIICARWEEILGERKEKGWKMEGILVSAYINIVLYALSRIVKEEKLWIQNLEKWTKILNKDMERWFTSKKQMSSYYFSDLSYIYLLLFLRKNGRREKSAPEVTACMELLKTTMKKYSNLWGMGAEDMKRKKELQKMVGING